MNIDVNNTFCIRWPADIWVLCVVFGEYSNVCTSSLSLSILCFKRTSSLGVAEPTHGTPPTSFSYSDSFRRSTTHTYSCTWRFLILPIAGTLKSVRFFLRREWDCCSSGKFRLNRILQLNWGMSKQTGACLMDLASGIELLVFSSLVLSGGQRALLCVTYRNGSWFILHNLPCVRPTLDQYQAPRWQRTWC